MLSRGYDDVTVSDIVDRANVGRSTFYEHFESKNDLFRHSLGGIVPALADAVCEDCDRARMEMVVRHFWDRRDVVPTMTGGTARIVMIGYLAEEIETRLARGRRHAKRSPALPLHLIATQIAEAQCGLLVAWIASNGVPVERVAEVLAASSRAIAAASGF